MISGEDAGRDRIGSQRCARVGPMRGDFFLYELGMVGLRISNRASLVGRAEGRFTYAMGMAEAAKMGYQTSKIGVGWESLGRHGLPNKP